MTGCNSLVFCGPNLTKWVKLIWTAWLSTRCTPGPGSWLMTMKSGRLQKIKLGFSSVDSQGNVITSYGRSHVSFGPTTFSFLVFGYSFHEFPSSWCNSNVQQHCSGDFDVNATTCNNEPPEGGKATVPASAMAKSLVVEVATIKFIYFEFLKSLLPCCTIFCCLKLKRSFF